MERLREKIKEIESDEVGNTNVELCMDEKRKEELNIKENRLMMRQAGFIALMVIVFIPYFKFCAYLSNLFWFSYFTFNITMLLGIPFSYFAAKYIVRVIKKLYK